MQKLKHVTKGMFKIFSEQRVTRSAASMSYYITISVFPALIVIYAILTSLNISNENIYGIWEEIIPKDVLNIILQYMRYVSGKDSAVMLFVGITVMLTSSTTAFGTLMKIMADIQGKSRYTGFWAALFNIALSIGFLGVIYVSGVVIMSGEWLIGVMQRSLGSVLLEVWQWVRFGVLFFLMLGIIYLVYLLSAPREKSRVKRMPGAFLSAILLVAVSAVFSRFIGQFTNYPIIYGSLASFIILMLWIYFCSIILIMGNVFNIVVYHKH